jgi:hypothetical protein
LITQGHVPLSDSLSQMGTWGENTANHVGRLDELAISVLITPRLL